MRVCLSGDPDCTGIAPCEACDKAMLTHVLPLAMIGGGFNGNAQVAQAFFLSYKEAHQRLIDEVAQKLSTATPAPPVPAPSAPTPEPPPAPTEERVEVQEVEVENTSFTEDDIVGMGQVEDFVEEEETTTVKRRKPFPPKAARAIARKARKLKAERAEQQKKEEEHHGNE